jgi:predicted methyltransferase
MSLIVRSANPAIHMNSRAIPLLALVTALSLGCNARSSQNAPATASAQPPAHEHSTGSEHGCPDLHTYAHQLDEPERDEWQRPTEVIELLQCRPGMTVVDLGAGTGYFLQYLSKAVGPEGHVLALDISRSSVDWVSSRIDKEGLRNVRPEIVAPDDPALPARSIDRILVANTWHHISERVAYAKKLLAALRPGGLLLIVDFTIDSPEGPPPHMRLTRDTVARELAGAGFAVEVVEESLPYQYVVAGRVP